MIIKEWKKVKFIFLSITFSDIFEPIIIYSRKKWQYVMNISREWNPNVLKYSIDIKCVRKKMNSKWTNCYMCSDFPCCILFTNVFINACKLGLNQGVEIFLTILVLCYDLWSFVLMLLFFASTAPVTRPFELNCHLWQFYI